MATPTIKSFDKSMEVLRLLLESPESMEIDAVCREVGVPMSTAYRYLTTLTRSGLLFRRRRGTYLPNPAFLKELARFDANAILGDCVRPGMAELGETLNTIVHFGVLEDEMVNYLVKITPADAQLFTRENQQLEAYCSAIGKVLLADLPDRDIDVYLSSGAFPSLTSRTMTAPEEIRSALMKTREQAFGVDDGEIDDNLFCLAVPVRDVRGRLLGAVSASSHTRDFITNRRAETLSTLRLAAGKLSAVFGTG